MKDKKAKANAPIVVSRPVTEIPKFDIEGLLQKYPNAIPVQSPVKGQLLWQIDVQDNSAAPIIGTKTVAGEPIGYVQTYYGMEELIPAVTGALIAVTGKQGEQVVKGEIVALII